MSVKENRSKGLLQIIFNEKKTLLEMYALVVKRLVEKEEYYA